MAEGKDDLFLDYDDSATDATSSLEDIPSLESSLQLGSLPFGDLTRCPVTSSSEDLARADIISTCPEHLSNAGKNNVASDLVACCPLREIAGTNELSLIRKAGGCDLMDGAGDDQNNSASDPENATDNDDQDSFPLLIRSMSSSRRHSWEGPLSPSALGDMRRRLSLDLLGIDSDGEGDREDEDQSDLSQDPSAYEFAETLSSSIVSTEIDTQPTSGQEKTSPSTPEDKVSKQVKAATKMRPRLEAGYSCSSRSAQSHSSRCLPTSQSRETESETSLEIQEEKENLEPNHLLVQQVLLELKAFHGVRTASGSGKMPRSASPHDLTWMEFLAEKEGDEKCDRPEKGTKVKRTLSSLKNRVTGSFKDKGKTKEKESPKEKRKCNNGHQLVPGTFSSSTSCSLCSKPLSGKTGYQCMMREEILTINIAIGIKKVNVTLIAKR
ncbi:hypothetical protein scyTo_0008963 [Scyliorhinus torazame]|uniref:Uncharacterized protein n=1 Tax=Scyliorhinus torazame TaxID=75743 RepID=A0A401PFK5_SCYTO|nr:hypothetical protein [Scyliorhinus torazame]